MYNFIFGAIAMACGVVALFFLRFWRETRDRLFLIFALAFLVLGIERVVLVAKGTTNEEQVVPVYILRLVAFVLIILAIADKNRKKA